MRDRAVPVSLDLLMRLGAARNAFAVNVLLDDRDAVPIHLLVNVHFSVIGVVARHDCCCCGRAGHGGRSNWNGRRYDCAGWRRSSSVPVHGTR
jgi:hypothetical protein